MAKYKVGDIVIFPKGKEYVLFHEKRASIGGGYKKISEGTIPHGTVARVYNVHGNGTLDLFFFYGDNYANGFIESAPHFRLLERRHDDGRD